MCPPPVSDPVPSGLLTGRSLSDDPLIHTGGGRTEIDLDLLFDVHLEGSTITTDDVRDLTGPLWNLAENRQTPEGNSYVQIVRFIWGKHWNIPGVIAAVSERLEEFTAEGAPQRSWLRMKMLRVREPISPATDEETPAAAVALDELEVDEELSLDRTRFHEVVAGDHLPQIAFQYYGASSYWRLLASFNGIDDPHSLTPGMMLVIPPAPSFVMEMLNRIDTGVDTPEISFSSLLRLRPVATLRETL